MDLKFDQPDQPGVPGPPTTGAQTLSLAVVEHLGRSFDVGVYSPQIWVSAKPNRGVDARRQGQKMRQDWKKNERGGMHRLWLWPGRHVTPSRGVLRKRAHVLSTRVFPAARDPR